MCPLVGRVIMDHGTSGRDIFTESYDRELSDFDWGVKNMVGVFLECNETNEE